MANSHPLTLACSICNMPTKTSDAFFNLDVPAICQDCEHKTIIATKLGRQLNEQETPAQKKRRLDPGYVVLQDNKGFNIPGMESIYFAAIMENGGVSTAACRQVGLKYDTLLARRRSDPEFKERELQLLIEARKEGVRFTEYNLYKLANGMMINPVYDEEAYDLELPDHIDIDELTLDQIVKIARPVPRLKGHKGMPPNLPAMLKYLHTYSPVWRDAKKAGLADIEKFAKVIAEHLLSSNKEQYPGANSHVIERKLMSIYKQQVDAESENIS